MRKNSMEAGLKSNIGHWFIWHTARFKWYFFSF
jgi:hypothetical protein